MTVELEDLRIEEEALVAMFVDDIYIRVIGEDGGDEVAFFEAVVGERDGRNDRKTKKYAYQKKRDNILFHVNN